MKVITENDNNFGYEKITIVVDNMTLRDEILIIKYWKNIKKIINHRYGNYCYCHIHTESNQFYCKNK